MGEGIGKALPHRLPADLSSEVLWTEEEARKGVGVGNSWLQSSAKLTFADRELSDLRVPRRWRDKLRLPAVGRADRHLFRTKKKKVCRRNCRGTDSAPSCWDLRSCGVNCYLFPIGWKWKSRPTVLPLRSPSIRTNNEPSEFLR